MYSCLWNHGCQGNETVVQTDTQSEAEIPALACLLGQLWALVFSFVWRGLTQMADFPTYHPSLPGAWNCFQVKKSKCIS